MKQVVAILIVLTGFIVSCNETINPDSPNYYGVDYFPLDTSVWVLYDVVSITIDKPVNVYDTTHYLLKEKLKGPFTDNAGNTAYQLERWIKEDGAAGFALSDIWVAQVCDQSAQTVEENVRYVKIRFPAKINKSWNGNIFNTNDSQEFFIENIDNYAVFNEFTFDSTLTVVHELDSSLIHKNISKEIYAKNIGIVYKQKVNINSQEVIPDVAVEDRITTGTLYYQKIIGFGNN